MMTADRRYDDARLSRVEDRVDKAIEQLVAHVSSCDRDKVHAREWRETATTTLGEIKNTLRDMALGRATADGIRSGRMWVARLVWTGVLTGGGVIGWAIEHFKVFHS